VGVHFQVVTYKELTTFPSEWEAWKRFSSRCCKFSSVEECSSSFEVSKYLSSKCVKERSSKCPRISMCVEESSSTC